MSSARTEPIAPERAFHRRRLRRPAIFTLGIRFRLAFLFVLVLGATLVFHSAVLYRQFTESAESEFDVVLYNYAVDVAQSIDVSLLGDVILDRDLLANNEKVFPFSLGDAYLQIRTVGGYTMARSRNLAGGALPLTDAQREELLTKRVSFSNVRSGEIAGVRAPHGEYRVISYFIDKVGLYDFILQIAVPKTLLSRDRNRLMAFFFFSIPLTLVGAAFAGLYLSRKAMKPVNDIIAAARRIGVSELSARVPVPRADDEIRSLALTLNGLLDRLEQSFKSQEGFLADASHQLRTPLAVLKGEIDLMAARSGHGPEMDEFFKSTAHEVRYLSRLVEDLLVLARVDAGAAHVAHEPVRVDEIALEVAARLRRVADGKGVRLALNLEGVHGGESSVAAASSGAGVATAAVAADSSFLVPADPELTRCLIENLVENAIKYSPGGSSVTVVLRDGPRDVTVRVADQGPGIAKAEQGHIFDRFYRTAGGAGRASGAGLGLYIVKRVASFMSASISVDSREGQGSTFSVVLGKGLVPGSA